MREVTSSLIEQASLIIVDSLADCKREAGELTTTPESRLTELGSLCLIDGYVYDRPADRRSVYKSVGVGVQDVAIAALVVDKAEKLNIGSVVPFD